MYGRNNDITKSLNKNIALLTSMADSIQSIGVDFTYVPYNIDELNMIMDIIEKLPLLTSSTSKYFDKEYGGIFLDDKIVHLNLKFIPEENTEEFLIYSRDFGYISYKFPIGMTLNLALRAIKKTKCIIAYPWETNIADQYDESGFSNANDMDAFNFGEHITNDEHRKHIGQQAWELERLSAIIKLIDFLLKQDKEASSLLIKKYLDVVLHESTEKISLLPNIAQALHGLYGGWITMAEEGKIVNIVHVLYYTLTSFTVFKNSSVIRQCPLCGKLFFPTKRSDQIYCDYIGNPNYPEKTCVDAWNNIRPRLSKTEMKIINRIKNRLHPARSKNEKYNIFSRESTTIKEKLQGKALEKYLIRIYIFCYYDLHPLYAPNSMKSKVELSVINDNELRDKAYNQYLNMVDWLDVPMKEKYINIDDAWNILKLISSSLCSKKD
jgi:hypothetical protein